MVLPLSRRQIVQGSAAAAAAGFITPVQAAAAPPMVRLYLNENPYGPSDRAKQAISAAIDDGWKYDYEDAGVLRRLIAAKEGLKPENVFIAEGSTEILKIAGMMFAGSGTQMVAAMPTFLAMAQYSSRSGGQIRWVNLDEDMRLDLPAMESQMTDRTTAVYICNPNNPTGTIVDPEQLRSFIGAVSSRALVLVDEAYIDLSDDPEGNAMVDQVKLGRNVLIARTFSKVHGIAGLRVGYGLARPDIIRRLEEMRVSIPNRLGLKAAIASYQDTEFLTYSRKMVRACMAYTCAFFDKMKLPYTPSQANFVMFNTLVSGSEFGEYMRARNIMVNPTFEPYDTWCRVSMGRMEDMEAFAAAARTFFRKT